MSSYVLTPGQIEEVAALIKAHATTLAEKVGRSVKETAMYNRGSVVALNLKISFDPDDVNLLNLTVQEKVKHPKSLHSDMTSWDDPDVELAWKTNEHPGQQRVPGA